MSIVVNHDSNTIIKMGWLTQTFSFLNEVWTYCTYAWHCGEQCCVNVGWLAGGPAHSGIDSQWAAPPSNQPFTSALWSTAQLSCTVGRQRMAATNEVNKTMLSGNSPIIQHTHVCSWPVFMVSDMNIIYGIVVNMKIKTPQLTGICPRPESDQTTCHAAMYIVVLFVDGAPLRR